MIGTGKPYRLVDAFSDLPIVQRDRATRKESAAAAVWEGRINRV